MSISGIGGMNATNPFTQTNGPSKEIRDGMKALAEALKSGDLDAAKEAYSSLTKTLEEDSSTSGTQDARKQKLTDMLADLGEALDSGDITAAQDIFQQNAPKGPPPGGPQGGPPPAGGPSEDVMQGIGSLSEALQSGDLTSAQDAYESLIEQLNAEAEDGSSDPGRDNFLSLLSDVGTALQSGNVSSAQKLFAALTPRGQGVNMMA